MKPMARSLFPELRMNLMLALPQRDYWVNRTGAPRWNIPGEQSDNEQQPSNWA